MSSSMAPLASSLQSVDQPTLNGGPSLAHLSVYTKRFWRCDVGCSLLSLRILDCRGASFDYAWKIGVHNSIVGAFWRITRPHSRGAGFAVSRTPRAVSVLSRVPNSGWVPAWPRSARCTCRVPHQRVDRRVLVVLRPHIGHRLGSLARTVGVLSDVVEIRMYGMAKRGERDQWLALKKDAAKLPLQADDGVGQRGLGNAAAFGRSRETALLAEHQEVADLLHFHVPPRLLRSRIRGCHRRRSLNVR